MFNFGGFGGFPGMGGHGGPMEAEDNEPIDNERYYKILGLDKSASTAQIRKAYRDMAKVLHPDKGGDQEKFKDLQKAYETLNDPEKKQLYDKYGEKGVEQGGGGGGGGGPSGDIFDALFGGGRGRREQPGGRRQGPDVSFDLNLSLEDMYNGTMKKLKLARNIICSGCQGKGGTGDVKPCTDCKGRGVKVVIRQLGPGMIQQMQTHCGTCGGEGSVIPPGSRCTTCDGKKLVRESKVFEVFVEKGMKNGDTVVFRGEADQMPDVEPGNLVVRLVQKPHPVFKREGPHLFVQKTISLKEALTGCDFTLEHLDGRILHVKSHPREVIKPKDLKAIRDEGMPLPRSPMTRGNLYVVFDVEFPKPEEIEQHVEALRSMLPGLPAPAEGASPSSAAAAAASARGEGKNNMEEEPHTEEVTLSDVDLEQEKKRFAQDREAYHEDGDEEGPGGPRVGCRTQ